MKRIYKAIPEMIDGKKFYRFAPVSVPSFDEEGNETTKEKFYTIEDNRVHWIGSYEKYDVFWHKADTPELDARLVASDAYLVDDEHTLAAKYPEIAKRCLAVLYGEPDKDGNRASMLWADYDAEKRPRSEIKGSITAGSYFEAAKEQP